MDSAIVLSTEEVKEILAKHFDVDTKDVIRSQYSYFIKNVKGDKILSSNR